MPDILTYYSTKSFTIVKSFMIQAEGLSNLIIELSPQKSTGQSYKNIYSGNLQLQGCKLLQQCHAFFQLPCSDLILAGSAYQQIATLVSYVCKSFVTLAQGFVTRPLSQDNKRKRPKTKQKIYRQLFLCQAVLSTCRYINQLVEG